MTRSIWKGPFVHPSLLKKIDKLKGKSDKKPIKTWSRNSTIIPDFVGGEEPSGMGAVEEEERRLRISDTSVGNILRFIFQFPNALLFTGNFIVLTSYQI